MPDALKAPSATKFKINVDISTKCPWYNSVREVEPAIVEKNESEHFFRHDVWNAQLPAQARKKQASKFLCKSERVSATRNARIKCTGMQLISPQMTASKNYKS